MRVSVKVKTNARQAFIKKIDDSSFEIAVTASPIDGKANEAVIKALSKHFDIPKSRITIQSGHTSRNKIVIIE